MKRADMTMICFRILLCGLLLSKVAADEPFYFAGELTQVDHVNRAGILRPDRSDVHNKYHWDLPHHFAMKPEGAIYYNGVSAELADIPLGTHLHGWFELGPEGEFEVPLEDTNYNATVKNKPNEFSPDSPYNRSLRLEDDFTFYHELGDRWRIIAINPEDETLIAERFSIAKAGARGWKRAPALKVEEAFDFSIATRVWKGREVGTMELLEVGDEVLFNLTWATLYGPGKLTEIWRDEAAIESAVERQQRRRFEYLSRRGVPARIETVEDLGNGRGLITSILYPGVDAKVLEGFKEKSSGRLIAVDDRLRSYDQMNDYKSGTHQKVTQDDEFVEIQTLVSELIEGFRPGRSIRMFTQEWERSDLPREERLWPSDVRQPFVPEIVRPEG